VIDAFVADKASWIRETAGYLAQRAVIWGSGSLFPGVVLVSGEQYGLEAVLRKPVLVLDGAFKLWPGAPRAKEIFTRWYQASPPGDRRTGGCMPTDWVWDTTRCVSAGQEALGLVQLEEESGFTWRLVMVPLPAVDYGRPRSFCHLLEPNHSRLFGSRSKQPCPATKEQRTWLRMHGQMFEL
jgi:hypothetical protein